jgi:hypothetical protein
MTEREIQSHLEEMYGTKVSPTLISSVKDVVMDDAKAWNARPASRAPDASWASIWHHKTFPANLLAKAQGWCSKHRLVSQGDITNPSQSLGRTSAPKAIFDLSIRC